MRLALLLGLCLAVGQAQLMDRIPQLLPAIGSRIKTLADQTTRGAEQLLMGISEDIKRDIGYQFKMTGLQSKLKRIGIDTTTVKGEKTVQ